MKIGGFKSYQQMYGIVFLYAHSSDFYGDQQSFLHFWTITLLNSYPVSNISLYDFKVLFNAEHDTVGRFPLARRRFEIGMIEIRRSAQHPSQSNAVTL